MNSNCNMRMLSVIFFLLIAGNMSSQMLNTSQVNFCCHKGFVRTCYNLHQDGVFTYELYHCLGTDYATGTFEKKRSSYILTIFPSSPKITKQNEKFPAGKVSILCRDTILHSPVEDIRIDYKGQTFYSGSGGLAQLDYSGDEIAIYRFLENDHIIIRPDLDDSNSYNVTWNYYGKPYHAIVKMKKRFGNRYRSREIWYTKDINGKEIKNQYSFVYRKRVRKASICF